MQRLEVSRAVRPIYIYIYVIRRLKVKNEYSNTATPPKSLHGMDRNNLLFYLHMYYCYSNNNNGTQFNVGHIKQKLKL